MRPGDAGAGRTTGAGSLRLVVCVLFILAVVAKMLWVEGTWGWVLSASPRS